MLRSATRLLLAAGLACAAFGQAVANPLAGVPLPARPSLIETVRSPQLCNNWVRECTRFHGYQTRAWYACMGQPQAVIDCSTGRRASSYDDGYYPPAGRCSTWKRECAKLHGWQTYNWHQCMGQPGARRACR